jgi:hypothetical protein
MFTEATGPGRFSQRAATRFARRAALYVDQLVGLMKRTNGASARLRRQTELILNLIDLVFEIARRPLRS